MSTEKSTEKRGTTRQERLLREAITPYVNLDELRTMIANGDNLWAALRSHTDVPQDIAEFFTLVAQLFRPAPDERIRQPEDIAALLMIEMGLLDHEEFWEICLDTQHHIQRIHPLYKGTINTSVVRIGEVFKLPLLLKSMSIIIAHNHPSGSTPEASPEDIEATKRLVLAGELLEIEVLDHLIIGRGTWISLRQQGMGW